MTVSDNVTQALPALTVCNFNKVNCESMISYLRNCSGAGGNGTCYTKQGDLCEIALQTGCLFMLCQDAELKEEINRMCPEQYEMVKKMY